MNHHSSKSPAWTRREFLAATSLAAAWPLANLCVAEAPDRRVRMSDTPFQLGVASGDPLPDGVVLWTRLASDPLNGGGMPPEDVQVEWQVARDEALTKVVCQGTATASAVWAHSVHVEVDGLEPDREYWYRFKVGSDVSPVGRTRTAPAPDSFLDQLQFAFVSCQNYEHGYYTAYEHLAKEDLRLVVHLGDYIYERKPADNVPRHHNRGELLSLDDYRARYALYKMDPQLQRAHALFPWVVTWDDHEVANNYANDISENPQISPAEFLIRRANAYQAYYENLPLRKSSVPKGPFLQLYRTIPFGRLLQFSVLDTRQYRTDQPCGDGNKIPCAEVSDPRASLLGEDQERWLFSELSKSPARWNVLAQQVMMARIGRPQGGTVTYGMDGWSGYEGARRRLLQFLQDHKIANPVVLTGDVHSNWVNDLKLDFDRPESATVAAEFIGTSITSGGDGQVPHIDVQNMLSQNPFVKFYDNHRGYVRCRVTANKWRTDLRTVEYVTSLGAACQTQASFVVENGRAGAVLS